jgi:5'-nucleotidase
MNTNRRSFLKKNVLIGGGLIMAGSLEAMGKVSKSILTNSIQKTEVNVMYTNDVLGEIDPVNDGLGGLSSLHSVIQNEEIAALFFDAGGFLNPNHSIKKQLLGLDFMNKSNYHAVNLSAADLSQGLTHFSDLLPYINFQMVSCNYHFENQKIKNTLKSYQIFTYGKFRVGVTGVGEVVNLEGLSVSNPEESLNKMAAYLKDEQACDLIICLAHLGFDEKMPFNNKKLAESSNSVDLVIGGNAKVSTSQLWLLKNKDKEGVLMSNNYNKALSLARVKFSFNTDKQKIGIDLKRYIPGLSDRKEMALKLMKFKELGIV